MSDPKTNEPKPAPKKPRVKRTYHLIELETGQIVATEPSLKLLREFKPTDDQSNEKRQFIEVAQIGKPFIIRKVTVTKREAAK